MNRYLRVPRVTLLGLGLILLALASFAGGNQLEARQVAPAQNLRSEEAVRFLKENNLYEQVVDETWVAGRPFVETDKLLASDGANQHQFGTSVALDGETAVIGAAGAEAAYIYGRDGAGWTEQAKLTASDGAAGAAFGHSVAISGNTVVVGAYEATVNGSVEQGAAYVYVRDGAGWTEQAKLVARDGVADDYFGMAVAIEGNTVVVGATDYCEKAYDLGCNAHESKPGAAYVFVREGTSWSQQVELAPGDSTAGDRFGFAVAMEGDTVVVGAHQADMGEGATYIFVRSGTSWSQQAKLTVSHHKYSESDDFFGYAVAIDGETVAVSALGLLAQGYYDYGPGTVYVFTREAGVWSEQAALEAREPRFGYGRLGLSVALDGETVLVGADSAVYVFTFTGTGWTEQSKLTASDFAQNEDRLFGAAVALAGETAFVGAPEEDVSYSNPQGAAYILNRSTVGWHERPELVASDGVEADGRVVERFGASSAVSGDIAVIGAPLSDVRGSREQGMAYIFVREGTSWVQEAKLIASDGAQHDSFGRSVDIDGNTVVVGTSGEGAYVFVREGTSWVQEAKLTPGIDEFHAYGESVAVDGETVVMGDGYSTAYIFVRSGTTWSQQASMTIRGDHYGHLSTLAFDGDTVVLGTPGYREQDYSLGAAYIFVRDGTTWTEQAKLTPEDTPHYSSFGAKVAVDGDTVVVGAPDASMVHLYVRNGTTWTEQAEPTPDETGYSFGSSVDIAGETLVVGERETATAYVFVHDGSNWVQQAKLTDTSYDVVGPVAVDGDTVLLYWTHVFTREGTGWTQQAVLQAAEGDSTDGFGIAVALDGDTAVVGAYGANVGRSLDQGAAYVFVRDGDGWIEQAKLTAGDGTADAGFGYAVAISGDRIVVSAYGVDVGGDEAGSAAYVFMRDGDSWTEQAKLVAGDAPGGFGVSVAVAGQTVVVGAPYADTLDHEDEGAAYVFAYDGTSWSEQAKLNASDRAEHDWFGSSLAISEETVLVGAKGSNVVVHSEPGAVYVFVRAGDAWSEQAKLLASDGAFGDRFGTSVALVGDTALVGAPEAEVEGKAAAGAAYVFRRTDTSWSEQTKLAASDNAHYSRFGTSVALDGEKAVIGAIYADIAWNEDQGAAYIFGREGTAWVQQNKVTVEALYFGDPGPEVNQFGVSVAVAGDMALVGAPLAEVEGSVDQGAVYLYSTQVLNNFLPALRKP